MCLMGRVLKSMESWGSVRTDRRYIVLTLLRKKQDHTGPVCLSWDLYPPMAFFDTLTPLSPIWM